MDTSIQANGALQPEPDPRVQELLRQNQDLQHRLADAEREKDQLQKDLDELRQRLENCRIMLTHYVMSEDPPVTWQEIPWDQCTPIEDLIAEFKK